MTMRNEENDNLGTPNKRAMLEKTEYIPGAGGVGLVQQTFRLEDSQISENHDNHAGKTDNDFIPKLSFRRPHVIYVDVNIAHEFANIQSRVGTLFSFATLCLGILITSLISLVQLMNAVQADPSSIATHTTISIIMAISTLTLMGFAYVTNNKAQETKSTLIAGSNLDEIELEKLQS